MMMIARVCNFCGVDWAVQDVSQLRQWLVDGRKPREMRALRPDWSLESISCPSSSPSHFFTYRHHHSSSPVFQFSLILSIFSRKNVYALPDLKLSFSCSFDANIMSPEPPVDPKNGPKSHHHHHHYHRFSPIFIEGFQILRFSGLVFFFSCSFYDFSATRLFNLTSNGPKNVQKKEFIKIRF